MNSICYEDSRVSLLHLRLFVLNDFFERCNANGSKWLRFNWPLLFLSLAEFAESIGDGKSDEFKEAERKRIMDLLENF